MIFVEDFCIRDDRGGGDQSPRHFGAGEESPDSIGQGVPVQTGKFSGKRKIWLCHRDIPPRLAGVRVKRRCKRPPGGKETSSAR